MVEVSNVQYERDYRLSIEFSDGTHGTVDLTPEIHGALEPLRDLAVFRQAFVQDGTVCWPGELDLAPSRLYALVHDLPIPDSFESADQNVRTMSLRALREMLGVSQTDLAAVLGVPQSNLSRFESSDDVKLSTLQRYVTGLGGRLDLVVTVGSHQLTVQIKNSQPDVDVFLSTGTRHNVILEAKHAAARALGSAVGRMAVSNDLEKAKQKSVPKRRTREV